MEYENLALSLKEEIKCAYMINGTDGYLAQSALTMIENAINLTLPEMNRVVYSDQFLGKAVDIVTSLEAVPVMDDRRIVIVQDFVGKKDEKEKEVFINYLKNPNPQTCLVFYSSSQSDFFTSFMTKVELISCDKVSDRFLYNFVNAKLVENNLKADDKVKTLLIDYCNHSPLKIETEINKLSSILSSREDRSLSTIDVENFITKDIEFVIFDLTNAVSDKRVDRALEIVENMLRDKESPVTIISLLSSHFRRLFLTMRSEGSNSEIATLLSIKEYAVSKYKQQSRKFNAKNLKDIFDECVECEFKAKSGEMEGKSALYYLLAKILN